MKLSDYLRELDTDAREAFAAACGTTWFYMKNVAYSGKQCGPKLALAIERETGGLVSRPEIYPQWREIWPELEVSGL